MTNKQRLLETLDDLGDDEFTAFKWHLKETGCFKKAKLESADTRRTVDLITQRYSEQQSVMICIEILKEIPRNDLAEKLSGGTFEFKVYQPHCPDLYFLPISSKLLFKPYLLAHPPAVHLPSSQRSRVHFPTVYFQPPKFTRKMKDAKPELGKMAEFQCRVKGSPPFSLQWLKDDSVLEDPILETTFENSVATLRIPACEVSHNGKYTCRVENEAGEKECSATLVVQVFPQITQLIKVKMGDPICLECEVTGSPELRVKWMKDGKQLQSTGRHKLSFEKNISSLKIESAQKIDDGEYVLMVENHVGHCTCKIKVNVQETTTWCQAEATIRLVFSGVVAVALIVFVVDHFRPRR